MVLANMVCSRLCEELWLFFFVSCAYLRPEGGPAAVKNKINTSGVAWGGRERTYGIGMYRSYLN